MSIFFTHAINKLNNNMEMCIACIMFIYKYKINVNKSWRTKDTLDGTVWQSKL